jgi:tetratricopeptide (TPR) repeat protein
MTRQNILLLGLLIVLLAWGGCTAITSHGAPTSTPSSTHPSASTAGFPSSAHRPSELETFLDAASRVDGLADPLQRCLQYPDLPASHWQHDTVAAYCRYLFQPHLSYEQIRQYIQSNHTDELEKQLQQALQAQQNQPASQGLLDQIYKDAFCCRDGSHARALLDSWIRQAPHSAFAYAASGWIYIDMAFQARGAAYSQYTAPYRMDDMDGLLQKADNDFKKAMAINPRIMAIYAGMIEIGGMTGDNAYINEATNRALKIDPANLSLYLEMLRMGERKWAGLPGTMPYIAELAQRHQAANPLLAIVPVSAAAYMANLYDCDCQAPSHQDDHRIFDSLPSFAALDGAGIQAWTDENTNLSAIYLTESSRFGPYYARSLVAQATTLARLGYRDWALAVGARAQQFANANDAWLPATLGQMYEGLKDYPDAELALEKSHQIDPTDNWSLRELGRMYVYNTHEWDKGWNVANQLISVDPDQAVGWVLRASIQKDQPRAGLDDTLHYFIAHFGNDPRQQQTVKEMRATLAKEGKT